MQISTSQGKESSFADLPSFDFERKEPEGETVAEEGQVISCHTVESWAEQFQLAKESKKLVKIYLVCLFDYHVLAFKTLS